MTGVPGQGRKFDYGHALDTAMLTFWRHGYEGTSITQLTKELGINAPSLYAAFGGKEQIFLAAVDHYNATRGDFVRRAFDESPDSPTLIRRLLLDTADAYAPENCPGGCLIITSALTVGSANQHIADRLRAMRNANVAELAARLTATRHLYPDTDPHALAEYISAVIQGMSQRARDGTDHSALRAIAETALRAVPFNLPV